MAQVQNIKEKVFLYRSQMDEELKKVKQLDILEAKVKVTDIFPFLASAHILTTWHLECTLHSCVRCGWCVGSCSPPHCRRCCVRFPDRNYRHCLSRFCFPPSCPGNDSFLFSVSCYYYCAIKDLWFLHLRFITWQASTVSQSDRQQWLSYWVIYGLFDILAFFEDVLFGWLPLLDLFKVAFFVWLFLPNTRVRILAWLLLSNQSC